jgi:hypothetical protein
VHGHSRTSCKLIFQVRPEMNFAGRGLLTPEERSF